MVADDTKSFTITLADPCAGVTCPNKCSGYDLYSQKCANGACVNDTLIEHNSATCGYVAPTPAQGQLEEVTYPVSVAHGAAVSIGFSIHNIGGSSGTFRARLYQGATQILTHNPISIQAGVTTRDEGFTVTAPRSLTINNVTYTLKLFLET